MLDAEQTDAAENIGLSLEDEIGAALDAAPNDVAEPSGRARDDAGRFAPAQPAAAATVAQPAAAEAPKPPVWYKPEYGDWGQVPDQMRAAILDRERAISAELERRANEMRPWQSVSERLAPIMPHLQAHGVGPDQFLGSLIAAHDRLTTDPVAAMQWLADQYGVDLSALSHDQDLRPQVDPVVQQLQQQVAQITQAFQHQAQQSQRQQEAAIQNEIAQFAQGKSDFDTLRPIIAGLIQTGQARDLSDAYEKARWAHPETRQRILEEQRKAGAEEAKRARAAGSALRGAPVNGAVTRGPELTLEEELAAAFDAA